jgi:hypothetical protein
VAGQKNGNFGQLLDNWLPIAGKLRPLKQPAPAHAIQAFAVAAFGPGG